MGLYPQIANSGRLDVPEELDSIQGASKDYFQFGANIIRKNGIDPTQYTPLLNYLRIAGHGQFSSAEDINTMNEFFADKNWIS